MVHHRITHEDDFNNILGCQPGLFGREYTAPPRKAKKAGKQAAYEAEMAARRQGSSSGKSVLLHSTADVLHA